MLLCAAAPHDVWNRIVPEGPSPPCTTSLVPPTSSAPPTLDSSRMPRSTHDFATAHAKGCYCGTLQFNHERLVAESQILLSGLTSFLTGHVVQLRFNGFTSDPVEIAAGVAYPNAFQSHPFSKASTHSHYYSKPTDGPTVVYMHVDDDCVLAWSPSYRLLRTHLL